MPNPSHPWKRTEPLRDTPRPYKVWARDGHIVTGWCYEAGCSAPTYGTRLCDRCRKRKWDQARG
jgi:hypothetical protein